MLDLEIRGSLLMQTNNLPFDRIQPLNSNNNNNNKTVCT